MPVEAAIDNDVLIKGAAFGILEPMAAAFNGVAVLGVARFVVAKRIGKHAGISNSDTARARWEEFLAGAEELEPTEAELALSTAIEVAAAERGLQLDAGESQLCAITVVRAMRVVVTGDKRAIAAVEHLFGVVPELAVVEGRWVCLEQLVLALAERVDPDVLRAAICAEPRLDRALTICMGCGAGSGWSPEGLESYVRDLRGRAQRALCRESLFN